MRRFWPRRNKAPSPRRDLICRKRNSFGGLRVQHFREATFIRKEQVMRMGITGLALTAAVALSVSGTLAPAAAASAGITAKTHQASGDELSSAKRRHARVYRHYRGNAGPAQAFGAIAGTIGGI